MNALTINKTARTANKWLEADQIIAERFGKAAFNAEFRRLLLLLPVECVSIKQAFLQCALSNRAFYLLILALKERKIITVAPDSKDRRVKLIRLEPQARAHLDAIVSHLA